jgi:hypothetical protein
MIDLTDRVIRVTGAAPVPFDDWAESWRRTLDVNRLAPGVLCREAITAWRESGGGIIVDSGQPRRLARRRRRASGRRRIEGRRDRDGQDDRAPSRPRGDHGARHRSRPRPHAGLRPAVLELGGHAPATVCAHADVDAAAAVIAPAPAKSGPAGQS